jgi:hypothetical protein
VVGVTIDGVWISNWIYWTLTLVTTNNYDSLTKLHTPKIIVKYSTHKLFSVFTSRCLVAASNSWRSPSPGFLNCPRAQLPASHFSQLQFSTYSTTAELLLIILPRHGPHRKYIFYYCVFSRCRRNNVSKDLLPNNGCCTVACLHGCYLTMCLHVTIFKMVFIIIFVGFDIFTTVTMNNSIILDVKSCSLVEIYCYFIGMHSILLHGFRSKTKK